jgi:hypothetical protein
MKNCWEAKSRHAREQEEMESDTERRVNIKAEGSNKGWEGFGAKEDRNTLSEAKDP